MEKKIVILYTSVNSEPDAEMLACTALQAGLATCINIFPYGKSCYVWHGKIRSEAECYMIFKTNHDCVSKLQDLILQHHPYETPAILKYEASASEEFYSYICNNLRFT